MSRFHLVPHVSTPASGVERFEVALRVTHSMLHVRYLLRGDIENLRIPAPRESTFANELWRHTCCELFVASDERAYFEFNFSPSGAWALYSFSDYRMHMTPMTQFKAPVVTTSRTAAEFELAATIDVESLPIDTSSLLLALSAVVEQNGGAISYWSLQHPAGKPDFHHRAGFARWNALGG